MNEFLRNIKERQEVGLKERFKKSLENFNEIYPELQELASKEDFSMEEAKHVMQVVSATEALRVESYDKMIRDNVSYKELEKGDSSFNIADDTIIITCISSNRKIDIRQKAKNILQSWPRYYKKITDILDALDTLNIKEN